MGGHMLEQMLRRGSLPTSILVFQCAAVYGQTTVVRAARMLDVVSGEIRTHRRCRDPGR